MANTKRVSTILYESCDFNAHIDMQLFLLYITDEPSASFECVSVQSFACFGFSHSHSLFCFMICFLFVCLFFLYFCCFSFSTLRQLKLSFVYLLVFSQVAVHLISQGYRTNLSILFLLLDKSGGRWRSAIMVYC